MVHGRYLLLICSPKLSILNNSLSVLTAIIASGEVVFELTFS